MHQDGFGQLQLQQGAGQAVLTQHRRHPVDEVVLLELQGRDIDRHRHHQPGGAPQRGLAHRLHQHPVADGDDEAGVLGHRDEGTGRDLAQRRVAPADQGLGADHRAAAQADLRLVVQAELLAGQGLAHCMVQPHALAQVGVLLGLVEAEGGAPALLGAAHRRFGMADQLLAVAAVLRVHGQADAAGQREAQAVDGAGVRDGRQQPARSGLGAGAVGVVQQQRKLVAADARHPIALTRHRAQAVGTVQQHPVGAGLAQAVVDLLEAVQVQHQQGQRGLTPAGQCNGVGQVQCQLVAVGQAGQHVAARQGLDAVAGGHQLGVVAE